MGFKDIFISLMVVGVLFLSMMSWIIITQTDNNTENLITNNTLINESFNIDSGSLQSGFTSGQSQADIASGTFTNITPSSTLGFVTVTSIVSPTRIFKGLILGTYNILIRLPGEFLGVPEVIIAIINAILALILILGVWFVWKGVSD